MNEPTTPAATLGAGLPAHVRDQITAVVAAFNAVHASTDKLVRGWPQH